MQGQRNQEPKHVLEAEGTGKEVAQAVEHEQEPIAYEPAHESPPAHQGHDGNETEGHKEEAPERVAPGEHVTDEVRLHQERTADGQQGVGLCLLRRRLLHHETHPEVDDEQVEEAAVQPMVGGGVVALQREAHRHAHDEQQGGVVGHHEPGQELHKAVPFEHRVALVLQRLGFLQ